MSARKKKSRVPVPACVASMGCLCAWHARGGKASEPCNASEDAWPPGTGPVSITRLIPLTDAEIALLREALDSHAYWQLSEATERHNGYVVEDEEDDPDEDRANAIAERKECTALDAKLAHYAPTP